MKRARFVDAVKIRRSELQAKNFGHREPGDQSRFTFPLFSIATLQFNIISGCSAVGSAPALGACLAFNVLENKKPQNPCIYAGFGHL